jgi:hypothetical protein
MIRLSMIWEMMVPPRTRVLVRKPVTRQAETSCLVVNLPGSLCLNRRSRPNWAIACVRPRCPLDWPRGHELSARWPPACPSRKRLDIWGCTGASCALGARASANTASQGWPTAHAPVAHRGFPPDVAVPLLKMAGERPDKLGRSLSPGDGLALARQRDRAGIVEPRAPETVRRLLVHPQLKPWGSVANFHLTRFGV